jgi:hypothetical protein
MNKQIILIYLKRYWGYIAIGLVGLVSILIFFLKMKSQKKQLEGAIIEDRKRGFALGELKGNLTAKKEETELELKAIKSEDTVFQRKVDRIKTIKDSNSRREKINEMLKNIPLILLALALLISCAVKDNNIVYPSYMPPKININDYIAYGETIEPVELEDSEKFGRIPFTKAIITLMDGSTMSLSGGFAIDDNEALKFIMYHHNYEICQKRLDLMIDAYDTLYDGASKAEVIWQDKLKECDGKINPFIEEYDCQICYGLGVATCATVIYSVDVVVKE